MLIYVRLALVPYLHKMLFTPLEGVNGCLK
jgi:hypothetical protein